MRKIFLIFIFLFSLPAFAYQLNEKIEPSMNLAKQGLSEIISGSLSGNAFTITSIHITDHETFLSLRNLSDSNAVTLKLSTDIVEKASLNIGHHIYVNMIDSGYVLLSANKPIAFIPNASGKTLIYSQQLDEKKQ